MAGYIASRTLLLDVGQFATRSEFAIPADDTATDEGAEPQEPDETHG
jgi:hypothetical protein